MAGERGPSVEEGRLTAERTERTPRRDAQRDEAWIFHLCFSLSFQVSLAPDFRSVASVRCPRGDGVPALVRVAIYLQRLVHLLGRVHVEGKERMGGVTSARWKRE